MRIIRSLYGALVGAIFFPFAVLIIMGGFMVLCNLFLIFWHMGEPFNYGRPEFLDTVFPLILRGFLVIGSIVGLLAGYFAKD